MAKQENILALMGDIVWGFDNEYFVKTPKGNFVYSDPFYNGDNTLRRFNGSINDWYRANGIPYGRHAGRHIIGKFCQQGVKIK